MCRCDVANDMPRANRCVTAPVSLARAEDMAAPLVGSNPCNKCTDQYPVSLGG